MRCWPVAVVLVGCALAVDRARVPGGAGACDVAAAWPCPAGWVARRTGGCGPAFRACPAGDATREACARVDLTVASSPAHPWAGVREGVDTPARDWRPPAGIARCPDGWLRRDDGTCDPNLSVDCPAGTGALPGGRCTATGVSDCPVEAWPRRPEGLRGQVIHARAGGATRGADGSTARPFPTLAGALRAARRGDTIALGDGAYALPAGAWPKDVGLAGRCAARVTVTAADEDGAEVSGVVAWRGMTLRKVRLSVASGASFSLARAVWEGMDGGALEATGATVALDDVWVRGPPEPYGDEFPWRLDAAWVRAHSREIERAAAALFELREATTARAARVSVTGSHNGVFRVVSRRSALTVTQAALVDVGGRAIFNGGARLSLSEVAVRGARGEAVFDEGGDETALDGVAVEDLRAGANSEAIVAAFSRRFTARRLSVRNAETAFRGLQRGPIDLDEVAFVGCASCVGVTGHGRDEPAAEMTLRRALVRASGPTAFMLASGARVTLRESEVAPEGPGVTETSIAAFAGARVTVDASRLVRTTFVAFGEGAAGIDRSVLVWEPRGPDRLMGWVFVDGGYALQVRRSLAVGGVGPGFNARGGARIAFEDSILLATEPSSAQGRVAVSAARGASVAMTRTALVGLGPVALAVDGADSAATLTDVDVTAGSAPAGVALAVTRGARVAARRLSVDGARGAAVLVDGASSSLVANDLHAARVTPSSVTMDAPRSLAACVAVQRGADAQLTRATLSSAPLGLALSDARLALTSAHLGGVASVGSLRSEGDRAGLSLTDVGVCRGALAVDPALPRLTPPELAER